MKQILFLDLIPLENNEGGGETSSWSNNEMKHDLMNKSETQFHAI